MITLIILATCVFSFLGFQNSAHFEKYKFSPYKINLNKEFVRWISGGFLHADGTHLFFNMITLYFTSHVLTNVFDSIEIVFFYLSALVVSGIPDYLKHKNNPYYAAIGASGAVSAALFSLLVYNPWGTIYIFFVIPMPFIVFAIFYLYYSFQMSKRGTDNIGHMAHLTGAIYGIVFSILMSPKTLESFIYKLSNPPSLSQMFGF